MHTPKQIPKATRLFRCRSVTGIPLWVISTFVARPDAHARASTRSVFKDRASTPLAMGNLSHSIWVESEALVSPVTRSSDESNLLKPRICARLGQLFTFALVQTCAMPKNKGAEVRLGPYCQLLPYVFGLVGHPRFS